MERFPGYRDSVQRGLARADLPGSIRERIALIRAQRAPPASEQERTEKITAVVVCLRDNARKLDDHRSDAATVAQALRPACDAAWHALDKFYDRPLSPAERRIYEQKNAELFLQYATGAVLRERAGN